MRATDTEDEDINSILRPTITTRQEGVSDIITCCRI